MSHAHSARLVGMISHPVVNSVVVRSFSSSASLLSTSAIRLSFPSALSSSFSSSSSSSPSSFSARSHFSPHSLHSRSSAVRGCPACRSFSTSGSTTVIDSKLEDEGSDDDFKAKAKKPVPSSSSSSSSSSAASDVITSDVNSHDVFLYMKGNPSAPKCGFSANVVRILQHLNAPFSSRDVLEDPAIREAVKAYSDWPTLPQLYVKGEFIGGSDIITQMFKSGELEKTLRTANAIQSTSPSTPSSTTASQQGQGAAQ